MRFKRVRECLAVAGIWALAGAAQGEIVLSMIQATPSPGNGQVQTLSANGWTCWVIRAATDAPQGAVDGFDLASPTEPNTPPFDAAPNHTGKDWGIFVSEGFMAQRWSVDPDTGRFVRTTEGPMPAGGLANNSDSHITDIPGITLFEGEDNNLADGMNPPFNRNPISGGTGVFDFGVGTYLKAVRVVDESLVSQEQDVAVLWLSPGSQVTVRGEFEEIDSSRMRVTGELLDETFTTPEAGSAGMLVVGVVMLMKRRRCFSTRTRSARRFTKGMDGDELDEHGFGGEGGGD